jgi:hypothetical protein
MWVFSRYGFYSVASASKPDGSIDSGLVMVRARVRKHLEDLQVRFPLLAGAEIRHWPDHDYSYRILMAKESWVATIAELAQEQEWSNFKDETEAFQGVAGSEYVDTLHRVWSIMKNLEVKGHED